MDLLKGKQIMVWTFMDNTRMYRRSVIVVTASASGLTKWLLTVANDGTNSIFKALWDNTDGAQDMFLSEFVRIMENYPWCSGIDIDLEKGDDYSTHESSTALSAAKTGACMPKSEPLSVRIFSKTEINAKVPNRFSRRSDTRRTAPLVQ